MMKYFFNTSLCLLTTRISETQYQVDVPQCKIQVRKSNGIHNASLKSWKLVFSIPKSTGSNDYLDYSTISIDQFLVNGAAVLDAPSRLSTLVIYLCSSLHPKIHSTSEAVMTKIETSNLTQLKASTHITRSLHRTLLVSYRFSPLSEVPLMSNCRVTKSSLLDEVDNWTSFHHTGLHLLKSQVPYLAFLWQARHICLKYGMAAGLDASTAEFFFLHTVMHSVDHYSDFN